MARSRTPKFDASEAITNDICRAPAISGGAQWWRDLTGMPRHVPHAPKARRAGR